MHEIAREMRQVRAAINIDYAAVNIDYATVNITYATIYIHLAAVDVDHAAVYPLLGGAEGCSGSPLAASRLSCFRPSNSSGE